MEVVANKYKVIAHCYCIMGRGHLTVHKLGCLGEETVIINTTTAESINILNTVSTSTKVSISNKELLKSSPKNENCGL